MNVLPWARVISTHKVMIWMCWVHNLKWTQTSGFVGFIRLRKLAVLKDSRHLLYISLEQHTHHTTDSIFPLSISPLANCSFFKTPSPQLLLFFFSLVLCMCVIQCVWALCGTFSQCRHWTPSGLISNYSKHRVVLMITATMQCLH